MANISTYLSNKLLGHAFGEAAYTEPTCYLALFTTAPAMPAGTGGVEVSGGAYARQALAGSMGAPASEAIASNAAVTFPSATASWGTVTSVGIFDASTSRNLLFSATLPSSATVNSGDTFTIPAGSLTGNLA